MDTISAFTNREDGIQRQLCTKNSFSLCSNLMTPLPRTVPLLLLKVVTNKQKWCHFPSSPLAFLNLDYNVFCKALAFLWFQRKNQRENIYT